MRTEQSSSGKIALLVLSVLLFAEAPIGYAHAKHMKCKKDEISVPDERPSGGNLCMKKSEWKRAKEICKKLGQSDPMQCVCQDADTVSACGD